MTNERKQGPAGAQGGLQDAGNVEPPNNANKQLQARRTREMRAKKYNQEHAKEAAEFQRLTGVDPMNIAAVKKWQADHGAAIDGKIGPTTLQAARPQAAARAKGTEVTFDENEGSTVEGRADAPEGGGEVLENPVLVDNILDGAKGLETAENDGLGTALEGGGDVPSKSEDAHKVSKATDEGTHGKLKGVQAEGPEAEGVEGEAEGEGGELPWMKLALAPAVVSLLRRGEYGDAVVVLARSLAPTEVAEALRYAGEKLGIDTLRTGAEWIAERGAQADVLFALVNWTYDGIKAVQHAHELGDEESRIRMYARAFADGFLEGEEADGGRAGAVTPAQKEAVELGLRDGSKTAAHLGTEAPAIGRELLRRCGDENGAKRLIMDELMKRAGLPGVWS